MIQARLLCRRASSSFVPSSIAAARQLNDVAELGEAWIQLLPGELLGNRPNDALVGDHDRRRHSTRKHPAKPALNPRDEVSSLLAFREVEASSTVLPVFEQNRVDLRDFLLGESFPAPEINLPKVGLETDGATRCNDRRRLPRAGK